MYLGCEEERLAYLRYCSLVVVAAIVRETRLQGGSVVAAEVAGGLRSRGEMPRRSLFEVNVD